MLGFALIRSCLGNVTGMKEPTALGSDQRAGVVVLVHGAWHGAWCWERVVDLLAGAGVNAIAVDLPGHGSDTGPLLDLHGDTGRVRDLLDGLDGPVVLVGHSYGGAVITEVGTHAAVSHLVYLCALALDEGETCTSAATTDPAVAAISHEGRPNLGNGLIATGDGATTLDPKVAAECLYNECDPDTVTWAIDRLGPHPILALQQSPDSVAWRSKPSTYVVCSKDMAIHPDLQKVMAKRCRATVEWDSDHSPFLSRPEALSALLSDLVSAG
jgi:pimeloyl-ACP methyl ester carboxylesterase